MPKKRFPKDLKFAGETIRYAFDGWQLSTLGELHACLEEVREEMESFDGDDLIADHWEELFVAADYAGLFSDPDDRGDDDWPLTFEYRLANVEESKRLRDHAKHSRNQRDEVSYGLRIESM